MKFDLLVVGAGPAGAMAAEHAARGGMRVALVEKQKLPRHKTCGGGMPMIVGDLAPDLPREGVIEARVAAMRHTYRFREAVIAPIHPSGEEVRYDLWMVQRSVFDNALAHRAAKAGAVLMDGCSVRRIAEERDVVFVEIAPLEGSPERLAADWVLGADGANGVTAKAAGLRARRDLAIAIEIEHPHRWGTGHPELRPDVLHLEYGEVKGGYAWVFPKGDHLNVGAGVFRPRKPGSRGNPDVAEILKRAIARYLAALDVPFDPASVVYHAHPLPIWQGREPLQSRGGRILLAGDAAGLINPVFGDGILHAMRSGTIAAECLLRGEAAAYSKEIHTVFARNFDAARRLATFFYGFSAFVYKHAVARPSATNTAARLLAGELEMSNVAGRALRRLKRLMAGQ